MASANMQESQNPKPSAEGIAGEPPRQLAPPVGNLLASGASSATSSASSTRGDPICFGSFEFAPHESTLQHVFADLPESMELAFGCFRYNVSTEGTLRYPDQIQSGPITSAAVSATSSASMLVRVAQIASTSTLASAPSPPPPPAPTPPSRSTSTPTPPSTPIPESSSASSTASVAAPSPSPQSPEPSSPSATSSSSTSCGDNVSYSTLSEWADDSWSSDIASYYCFDYDTRHQVGADAEPYVCGSSYPIINVSICGANNT